MCMDIDPSRGIGSASMPTPAIQLKKSRVVRRRAEMAYDAPLQEPSEHSLLVSSQRREEGFLDLEYLSCEFSLDAESLVGNLDNDAAAILVTRASSNQASVLESVQAMTHDGRRREEHRRVEQFVGSQRPKPHEPQQRIDVAHRQPMGTEPSPSVAFHRSPRGNREASDIIETQDQPPKPATTSDPEQ